MIRSTAARVAAIIVALLAVSLVNPTPVGANTGTPGNAYDIMPLGDSITCGGATTDNYRKRLADRLVGTAGLPVQWVGSQQCGSQPGLWNEGHLGWTIDDISNNVDGFLDASQPDYVLLIIGTNDFDCARFGTGLATTATTRHTALVNKILAHAGIKGVTVAKLPLILTDYTPMRPCTAAMARFNHDLPGAMAPFGSKVQVADLSVLSIPQMADDRHPNAAGYDWISFLEYEAIQHLPGVADAAGGWLPATSCPLPIRPGG